MPDRLDVGEARTWTYRSKQCKVVKNDIGHWCGYTQTGLRGFGDQDCFDHGGHEGVRLISVHGGLTYGPDEDGWVGFDCGHVGDLCLDEYGETWATQNPATRQYESVEACEAADDCTVWRLADVKRETERLADQFIALEAFVSALDS